MVKFTEIDGEFGVLVGGRGGWIINDSFVIGAGGAAWDPLGWGPDWDEDIDAFFVTEPALNILVNVTKHLRIGFGASYRVRGGCGAARPRQRRYLRARGGS